MYDACLIRLQDGHSSLKIFCEIKISEIDEDGNADNTDNPGCVFSEFFRIFYGYFIQFLIAQFPIPEPIVRMSEFPEVKTVCHLLAEKEGGHRGNEGN